MTRPGRGDSTTTSSARNTASGMLCVTRTTVAPMRCQRSSSSASKRSRVNASSALNGSSSSRTCGSRASARAIAVRWRMPPDSWDGYASPNAATPTTSRSSRARSRRSAAATPTSSSGNATLSTTFRQGSRRGSWKTRPDPLVGVAHRVTVDRHRARIDGQQAADDAQQRRLAGAVRPNHCRHRADSARRSSPHRGRARACRRSMKLRETFVEFDVRQIGRQELQTECQAPRRVNRTGSRKGVRAHIDACSTSTSPIRTLTVGSLRGDPPSPPITLRDSRRRVVGWLAHQFALASSRPPVGNFTQPRSEAYSSCAPSILQVRIGTTDTRVSSDGP